MDKAQMREKLFRIRESISRREEKNGLICESFLTLAKNTCKIFVYVSMGSEVDTRGIIDRLRGKSELYVPYTLSDKTMHAVALPSDFILGKADKSGNTSGEVHDYADGQADVTVVPLLGFDDGNYRIGYGAGCYDRYFARADGGLKVGLAYDEQLCEFTHDDTDVPLDIIITPTKVIRRK